jgi:hypothetical protein
VRSITSWTSLEESPPPLEQVQSLSWTVANCSWWALTSSDNSSYYKDCQQAIWEWDDLESHPLLDPVNHNSMTIESTICRLQVPFNNSISVIESCDELLNSRNQLRGRLLLGYDLNVLFFTLEEGISPKSPATIARLTLCSRTSILFSRAFPKTAEYRRDWRNSELSIGPWVSSQS